MYASSLSAPSFRLVAVIRVTRRKNHVSTIDGDLRLRNSLEELGRFGLRRAGRDIVIFHVLDAAKVRTFIAVDLRSSNLDLRHLNL